VAGTSSGALAVSVAKMRAAMAVSVAPVSTATCGAGVETKRVAGAGPAEHAALKTARAQAVRV
jgi:hypothetical protein